jgi:NADH:ubiquinone oxidoreductase subunit E
LRSGRGGSVEDTEDQPEITVEETPCGFLCPLAPAVEIDGRWRGRATPPGLAQIIQGLHE